MAVERLVRVHLHGALAERFGSPHEFDILTPGEAIRALSANFPEFRQAMLKYERYSIYADGDWRDEWPDAFDLPVSRELHLVPHVAGHGPAIVAAAMPMVTQALVGLAISAALWGIQQLFFKPEKPEAGDDKKSESYYFSGADNTTVQGTAVPVIYGRCYTGSVVVSAGVSTQDQQIASSSGRAVEMEADAPLVHQPRMDRNSGVPDAPAITLQNVSTDPDRPAFRLGPDGWRYMGVITVTVDDDQRTAELWMPPDAGMPYRWDYVRGFQRFQPGETGIFQS